MRRLIILIFFSQSVFATTIDEAINGVVNEKSASEVQVQNFSHKINRSNAIEASQKVLPNVYLYYNYVKPGTPKFDSINSQSGSNFGRFVTGLVQNNYGIAAEYNVFAVPQLLIKLNSGYNSTKASFFSTQSKKSEFYYNLATTYIALYRSQNMLELQAKVFETAKSRYEEVEKYFSYGRATKKDLLSAQSSFLTSQANLEKSKNDLTIAQQKYTDKFSTLHTNLTISETSLSTVANNLDELKLLVEQQNQDLQSLKYASKSYKSESYISAIDILPTINVGYREEYTIVDPVLSIPNFTQGTFYINARMDLLNMTKYLSTFRYNNEKNKKIMEAKIAKKNYVTEAQTLWFDVLHQEKMIDVLQKVVSNAKEIYAITKKEVEYGSKSITDELKAKEDLTKSEIDLMEAKLKKTENIYRLKYLTGKL